MPDAVIIDAVRSPMGKRNGQLSGWHPADLAAEVLKALADRNNLNPAVVDDVIMGCVMQVGAQGLNVGRNAVLTAGWPESVPATTIDRQCGSSQQSAHFAAQGVMAGAYDVAIAAGVEVMSMVPMGATQQLKETGFAFTQAMKDRYQDAGGLVPQGTGAEMIADRWDISRQDMDEYGLRSQQFAARARDEGRFDAEIIRVAEKIRDRETGQVNVTGDLVTSDGGIRESTLEKIQSLKPAFKEDGKVTAANSSQITDGASALLIMSSEKAEEHGLTPKARFHTFALAGVDPVTMLTGPIPATEKALKKGGLSIDDIDHFEVNEAFASVVLAWAKEHHPDMEKVNPNGGAIALGHPLGGSGARLMTTMVHELDRTGGRFGLQTMCEGGGLANATIIEML
ncbi:MAG: thiolase family protein [Acidimicrobiia bacterium]